MFLFAKLKISNFLQVPLTSSVHPIGVRNLGPHLCIGDPQRTGKGKEARALRRKGVVIREPLEIMEKEEVKQGCATPRSQGREGFLLGDCVWLR